MISSKESIRLHFVVGEDGHWLVRRCSWFRHVVLEIDGVCLDWSRDGARTYAADRLREIYAPLQIRTVRVAHLPRAVRDIDVSRRRFSLLWFNCSQFCASVLGYRFAWRFVRPESLYRRATRCEVGKEVCTA